MSTLRFVLACACLLACESDTFGPQDAAADAPTCPAMQGAYAVTMSGAACPVVSDPTVCITQQACAITLQGTTLSGTITVGPDGSFSSGAVREGAADRSGCVGGWSSGSSTLTIDCGGKETSQSCEAVLTRAALTCK